MNRIAYTRAITLIGKLAAKGFLQDATLTIEEQHLVKQCVEEYTFYHAHEEKPLAARDEVSKPRRAPKGL